VRPNADPKLVEAVISNGTDQYQLGGTTNSEGQVKYFRCTFFLNELSVNTVASVRAFLLLDMFPHRKPHPMSDRAI
jgi:hypothetical protein